MSAPPVWRDAWVRRVLLLDTACVVLAQQSRLSRVMTWPLVGVSRLGDGLVWALVMLMLPWLDNASGASHCAHLLVLGGINLVLYLCLKNRIARPRPFAACSSIEAKTRALDTFSFPSGHTLHAVSFSIVLSHHYPVMSALLWLFCLLVALSRVVLGLHYPTDVIFAAAMAALTAEFTLLWW